MSVFTPRSQEKGRTVLADVVPLDTPYVLGIFTGDLCNFRCEYCAHATDGTKRKNGERDDLVREFLSWDDFCRIDDMIKEFPHPIKKVLFSSIGEPTLHRRLPDMIARMTENEKVQSTELVTNGSLLTPELSEKLIESGLSRICISIQGMTEEKYQEICGYHIDYPRFLKQLDYLYHISRGKCKIHIKTVDLALDGGGGESFLKRYQPLCDSIYIDHVIRLFGGVDYDKLHVAADKRIFSDTKVKNRVWVCPPLFYTLYITPACDVVPCCKTPYPIRYGNLHEITLKQAWNGEKRLVFLCQGLQGKRFENPVCNQCVLPDSVPFKEDLLDEAAEGILQRLDKSHLEKK